MEEEFVTKLSTQALVTLVQVLQKCLMTQQPIEDLLGNLEFVVADYERQSDGVLEQQVLVVRNPPHIEMSKLKVDMEEG
jgi:hypothetical protein